VAKETEVSECAWLWVRKHWCLFRVSRGESGRALSASLFSST